MDVATVSTELKKKTKEFLAGEQVEEKRIQRREKEGDEECFSFLLLL